MVLIMIASLPLAKTIRKLRKDADLLRTRSGNYIACPEPKSEVEGRERECAWTWGSAFIGV